MGDLATLIAGVIHDSRTLADLRNLRTGLHNACTCLRNLRIGLRNARTDLPNVRRGPPNGSN